MGGNKMNRKNDIDVLFKNGHWEKLAILYSSNEIAKYLPFKDALCLAYQLLYNKNWDTTFQEYSVNLFYEIKNAHPKEWNSSWKYDALLGLACDITCRYDERYEAYKRAFDKAKPAPPRLLIEFARCCICPGLPPIPYDQAIKLILKALQEAPYSDGISLLCNIYSLQNDPERKDYWSKVLENSNQQFNSPSIEPKFLVEQYLQSEKKE